MPRIAQFTMAVLARLFVAAGERRATAAPEIVCYRAPGGAVVRVQRLTDTTAVRVGPVADAANDARRDAAPLRMHGDTLFLDRANVALRVTCPGAP